MEEKGREGMKDILFKYMVGSNEGNRGDEMNFNRIHICLVHKGLGEVLNTIYFFIPQILQQSHDFKIK